MDKEMAEQYEAQGALQQQQLDAQQNPQYVLQQQQATFLSGLCQPKRIHLASSRTVSVRRVGQG